MKGVKGYHNTALGHVSINGKKIKAPPKIKLNDNNIATLQRAVCDVFTESTDSPNGALRKPYGKYYSIMHDGIQKFSRELNGVFIRTVQLDDDGVKIINIPWKLSEIPGSSLNATKLVTHLLKTIASVKIPTKNAFDSFIQAQNAGISDLEFEFPPEFFKCCEIEHCDLDSNSISLVFNEWPVVLMADGCYTNNSASTALTNMFGFMSPSARCSSHAADGSVKRMSKSQTYSVEEVKVFVEHYRPILRHYQMSSKSTCILNDALQAMDMKQVHLMTWCPTQMSNLLTCAVQTVKNLFPLSDVLATCDIKVDDCDYFMSPKGLILVHLLADLEQVFVPRLLRKVNRDQSLMIEVFRASQKSLTRLDDFQTPLTDSFVDGLRFDDFGNILYEKEFGDRGSHHIMIKTQSRVRRGGTNVLEEIKVLAADHREKIVGNLRDNIRDQMQEDTIVEYASCFDLTLHVSKDDRIELARKLYQIYGKEYSHGIVDDGTHLVEHDAAFIASWSVTIKYHPKIECTVDEFIAEFEKLWPVFNRTGVNSRTKLMHSKSYTATS